MHARNSLIVLTVAGISCSMMSLAQPVKKITIPAGEYRVGCANNDEHCARDEGPAGGVIVNVPAFVIDNQEASVAEYRQCVEAGSCAKPFDYLRTHYCNYGAPQRDNYPINCVNWNNALSYCQWKGGRLAYEVEWEKAARAGATTPYPWGEKHASCSTAVMDPGKPGDDDFETDGCWRDLSWPRSSFPPNQFGLHDMVGGTSEWVMDWYDVDVHKKHYSKNQLTGPKTGTLKTIKGGSWDEKFWAQRVTNRFAKPVAGNPDLYGSNGIRCVYPLPESLK